MHSAAPVAPPADPRSTAGGAVTWLMRVVPVLVASVLLLPMLGHRSLWRDEAFTWSVATRPWGQIARFLHHQDLVFAAYYAVMHVWLQVSQSTAWLRLPGVVAGLLTVVVVQRLGERLWNSRLAGFFAGFLLAVHPSFLQWCLNARSYAIATLFVALSGLLLLRALRNPSTQAWALYVLSGVAAGYAHLFALLVIAAHVAAVLLARKASRAAVYAWLSIGTLCSPLLAAFSQRGQVAWIPAVNPSELSSEASFLLPTLAFVPVFVVAAALLVRAARARQEDSFSVLLAIGWALVPPALLLLTSIAHPIFLTRYTVVAIPGAVLVMVGGLRHLRLTVAAQAFAVLALVSGWYAYRSVSLPFLVDDYRSATTYLSSLNNPGVIVTPPNAALGIAFYDRASRYGQQLEAAAVRRRAA